MKKYELDSSFIPLYIMLFGIVLAMAGLWTIDIGVSAQVVPNVVTTNGWWVRDGVQTYHLGLYLTIAGNTLLGFSCICAVTLKKLKN